MNEKIYYNAEDIASAWYKYGKGILLDRLLKTKSSKKQRIKIYRVVSASNACGAEYGRLAYKQGFYDSIYFLAELSDII